MPEWAEEDDDLLPPSIYGPEDEAAEPLDVEDRSVWRHAGGTVLHRPPLLAPGTDELGALAGPLLEATMALVRLDERLTAAPAPVRDGWLARAMIAEAAASLVLDGHMADPLLLRIADADVYRAGLDEESADQAVVLHFVRAGATRSVRHMFTSRRLLASLRLPKKYRRKGEFIPDWPITVGADSRQFVEALDSVLTAENLTAWGALPPLLAAASIMTAWHNGRASEIISGAPGRVLATAWLRRQGLLAGGWYVPAVGFRGARADWTPGSGTSWPERLLAAAQRSAEWGLALHRNLAASHAELQRVCVDKSSASKLPQLVDAFIARPALTIAAAAATLGISRRGAAGLVADLHGRVPDLVRELTGCDAFRLYSVL